MMLETWRRPNTHQVQFPILKVWLSHLFLCEPSHEVPHLTLNLLFLCSCSISSHVVFFWFLSLSLTPDCETESKEHSMSSLASHAENNLSYLHLKPSVQVHLVREPFLTHRIWLNPPPLCFHSTGQLLPWCASLCIIILCLFFSP